MVGVDPGRQVGEVGLQGRLDHRVLVPGVPFEQIDEVTDVGSQPDPGGIAVRVDAACLTR